MSHFSCNDDADLNDNRLRPWWAHKLSVQIWKQ